MADHKVIAYESLQKFKAGSYQDCITTIQSLRNVASENKWFMFNKALAEYYQSNMKATGTFKEQLTKITGQPWPTASPAEGKLIEEAAIYYNYAAVLYHTRYYAQAYHILEKLFPVREKLLDSNLACRAVLLLLEVCLCRRLPDKVNFFGEQALNLFHNRPAEYTDMLKKLKLRASLMCRKQLLPPSNVQAIEWLFLRAHQQYINGDLQGAAVTLGQHALAAACQPAGVPAGTDELLAPINNNLGVIYSAMKKNNLSVKYMQQALKEHFKSLEGDNSSQLTGARDRPIYVFNLGVALLKASRPEHAFECLIEAARHFPNNPRIWLRLAEACVDHYNKVNRQEAVVTKIGSGPHAKLIPGRINKEKYTVSGESCSFPTLSLDFAALCLLNSVTLLPPLDAPADSQQFVHQAAPSSPMNYTQYCNLRNSALLLSSFVSLRLSDPTSALQQCSILLSRAGSPTQRALAHLYAAEALIALDRITEAIDHLNPTIIHNIANKMNSGAQDAVGVAVWLNGAVCHAVRGDLISARNILLQINSPRALPLQLYLEMCAGNTENCQTLLRKFTQVPL